MEGNKTPSLLPEFLCTFEFSWNCAFECKVEFSWNCCRKLSTDNRKLSTDRVMSLCDTDFFDTHANSRDIDMTNSFRAVILYITPVRSIIRNIEYRLIDKFEYRFNITER